MTVRAANISNLFATIKLSYAADHPTSKIPSRQGSKKTKEGVIEFKDFQIPAFKLFML